MTQNLTRLTALKLGSNFAAAHDVDAVTVSTPNSLHGGHSVAECYNDLAPGSWPLAGSSH